MKFDPIKIMLFIVGVFSCDAAFASNNPPPPIPPPPPGLPINEGMLLLVIASLVLGFYKIYFSKKASN